ncbi:hypothetical protein CSV79_02415 [Sporosarcina sp. P13]|uniref:DMP19 family protein n=1 Tax=Sporosarcina sp. P13 TaxID=2048263 RepID=UPI000C16E8B6|nr:hypothetical protein [Sporosarcina sp. P13]PIC65138.1 hypothetical protein CSV79_02415 [Sporosarcina sp. P13]
MKKKMKRQAVETKEDIWNAVIAVLSEYDVTKDKEYQEANIVFQYYSDMESGGHESLLNWFGEYIEEIGIESYIQKLANALEQIGAIDYALIIKQYGLDLWQLSVAMVQDEQKQDEFYQLIQKADEDYYYLDGKLSELLEDFFVKNYTKFIEFI